MFDYSNGLGLILFALCGIASLIVALLGTFLGGFSNTGFVLAAIFFVDIPLTLGLFGSATRQIRFPVLSILGSSAIAIWVLSIYGRDVARGLSSTSFLFEGWSWIYFGVNSINIFLSVMKIKQLRNGNGA